MTPEIDVRLQRLRDRIGSLADEVDIQASTVTGLLDRLENIEALIDALVKANDGAYREEALERISGECVRMEAILDGIKDPDAPKETLELMEELVECVLPDGAPPTETHLYPSPFPSQEFFSNLPLEDQRGVTVLVGHGNPQSLVKSPLRSLLAHEAAHLDSEIKELAGDDQDLETQKIAEVMCDVVGLCIMGPAYAAAVENLVPHIDDPTTEHASHPSWVSRAIIMHDLAELAWEGQALESVRESLAVLRKREEGLSPYGKTSLNDLQQNLKRVKDRASALNDRAGREDSQALRASRVRAEIETCLEGGRE